MKSSEMRLNNLLKRPHFILSQPWADERSHYDCHYIQGILRFAQNDIFMSTFKLEIVTPERVVYKDEVDFLSAPGASGTLGILPSHAPLFSQLTEGEIKIVKDKDDIFLSIGGGFLEVSKNKVTVLVSRAVNAEKLNEQEIIIAKRQAQEALKAKPSGKELVAAQVLFKQSLVDLQILRKRKKKL